MTTAAVIAVVAIPVAVSAYIRTRPRDYTRSAEFRAIVGDYLI
jgi:hypothetical protein